MIDYRRIILTIFLLVLLISFSTAQNTIDYIKIKKETSTTSCVQHDTNSVNLSIKNLLAIDTLKITNGLLEYRYDLGMNYYLKAALYKQNEWFYLAISNFKKCIAIDKKYGPAYYNIALIYRFLGDNANAKVYLNLYKKYTKKKYWDKDFISRVENDK